MDRIFTNFEDVFQSPELFSTVTDEIFGNPLPKKIRTDHSRLFPSPPVFPNQHNNNNTVAYNNYNSNNKNNADNNTYVYNNNNSNSSSNIDDTTNGFENDATDTYSNEETPCGLDTDFLNGLDTDDITPDLPTFTLELDEDVDDPNENFDPMEELFRQFPAQGDFLYDGAPITVETSLLLSLAFSKRHGLTKAALEDLLVLLSLHCKTPNKCVKSMYHVNRFLSLEKETQYKKCHYCKICYSLVADNSSICEGCDTSTDGHLDHFVTLPVEPQLQKLFTSKWFTLIILKNKFESARIPAKSPFLAFFNP